MPEYTDFLKAGGRPFEEHKATTAIQFDEQLANEVISHAHKQFYGLAKPDQVHQIAQNYYFNSDRARKLYPKKGGHKEFADFVTSHYKKAHEG